MRGDVKMCNGFLTYFRIRFWLFQKNFFQLIKYEKPLPGVLDMLKAGKRTGFKISLVTNSPSDWANHFLNTLKTLYPLDLKGPSQKAVPVPISLEPHLVGAHQ